MKNRAFLTTVFGVGLLLFALSISLSARAAGGSDIRGVVSQQSGQPLRSVWVIVSQNGSERGRSLTGDDGRYYIGDLDQGGYEIVVKSGDREIFRGSVNLPANQRYDIPVR
ncbi:MAG: Carboxypeptidase regulatory-like domain [Acidobacteriota bacterium]|jgi:hypothetical protein|nr:Carboxypeptidase regulatory-like domain [Acidobacteriota bacterium]